MALDAAQNLDWAHLAYVTLNGGDDPNSTDEKWPTFDAAPPSHAPSALNIPPSLLAQASVERYGQITPPDERSPADSSTHRDSPKEKPTRLTVPPCEDPWTAEQAQALQAYQPKHRESFPSTQTGASLTPDHERRRSARSTVGKPGSTDQTSTHSTSSPPDQPPKRKRGRPKAQPQMVDAFTRDGIPVQVSSARQSHLEKNRVAAHKCRQRKKEYIGGLESRAREFSAKNKVLKDNVAVLREEVLSLKNEVLRHAGCSFWAVDEYLARCAGDLLRMPSTDTLDAQLSDQAQVPTVDTPNPDHLGRASSVHTTSSHGMADSREDDELGFDLLHDFDEDMEAVG